MQYLSSKAVVASMLLVGSSLYLPNPAFAHTEHDKARFVSEQGRDEGRCDNPLRPCKSIAYAVRQANKGDHIRVADGSYKIDNADDATYLVAANTPIFGGYNRFDHFRNQNPDLNRTQLVGVPRVLVKELSERGFAVISDGFSQTLNEQLLAQTALLNENQTETLCENGDAGGFACENIDLLAHVSLNNISSRPGSASDVWGHVDLNTGREYAIMGLLNGTVIIDVTDPVNPVEVGVVSGTSTSWRDVKVYQYFDTELESWRAYAYVTSESTSNGLQIIDLNQLPNAVSLEFKDTIITSAHNVYISNVDHSLNIALPDAEAMVQLVGQVSNGGSFRSASLTDPRNVTSTWTQSGATRFDDYTHDAASTQISDARAQSECQNGSDTCSLLADFNENELRIWDISIADDAVLLSSATYPQTDYTHSGWFSEDNQYVFLHDELDERAFNLNTTVHVFDISSLTTPSLAASWVGPTQSIDHNGFVRGNRYYMSNYTSGLTVLDITDPRNPNRVGYFDTYPLNNSSNFEGAWGVYPYLPSGNILVSDINSGLYVLRDNTRTSVNGQLSFSTDSVDTDQDTSIELSVERTQGSNGAISVNYQLLYGSADSSDVEMNNGSLAWADGETGSKTISVNIAAASSADELAESFYVRLLDPKNGAVLGQDHYITVNIDGIVSVGKANLQSELLEVNENAGTLSIEVERVGATNGELSVNYAVEGIDADTGSDIDVENGTLTWAAGDSDTQLIDISINDDDAIEGDEQFRVTLSAADSNFLGSIITTTVTILDNDTNQAPVADAGLDREAATRSTVELNGSGDDSDGNITTYAWRQVSGTEVTIENADSNNATFVAPESAGDLEFELTVTDNFGDSATDNVVITVVEASQPDPDPDPAPLPTPTSSGGSSGSSGVVSILALLSAIAWRRRLNK